METRIISATIDGIKALRVVITIACEEGKGIMVYGAATERIKDNISRIHFALLNCNLDYGAKQLRIHIEPGIPYRGNCLDLAIATGILIATGKLPPINGLEDYFIVGGLGITGKVHEVSGLQRICKMAKDNCFKGVILPYLNMLQSKFVYSLPVYPVRHLNELVRLFRQGYFLAGDGMPELFERFFYN